MKTEKVSGQPLLTAFGWAFVIVFALIAFGLQQKSYYEIHHPIPATAHAVVSFNTNQAQTNAAASDMSPEAQKVLRELGYSTTLVPIGVTAHNAEGNVSHP